MSDRTAQIFQGLKFTNSRIVLQVAKFDNGGFLVRDMLKGKTGALSNDGDVYGLATQIAELLAQHLKAISEPNKGVLVHIQLAPNDLSLLPITAGNDPKTQSYINQLLNWILFTGGNKDLKLNNIIDLKKANAGRGPVFSPMFGEIEEDALNNNQFVLMTPEMMNNGFIPGVNGGINFFAPEGDVEEKTDSSGETKLTGKNK